jgi:hypothetical protein
MQNEACRGGVAVRAGEGNALSAVTVCGNRLRKLVKERSFSPGHHAGDLAGVRDRMTIMAAPEILPTAR